MGAAVPVLSAPATGINPRPPGGLRAPAAVRARVRRARLLRHRARRTPRGIRPTAAALHPAIPASAPRPPRRDGDRAGDPTGRDAAAARPMLHPAGGPQPEHDAANAASPTRRGRRVVLLDRARHPRGARRALPRGRPVLAHRRLRAARIHRPQRVLAVVPPAVRRQPDAMESDSTAAGPGLTGYAHRHRGTPAAR